MTNAPPWGVQRGYHDAAGGLVAAREESIAAVLAVLEEETGPEPPGPLILHPGDPLGSALEVLTEDGRSLLLEGAVALDVPLGYHTCLSCQGPRRLIVSPRRCHLPADLRLGGWAVQVYAARSDASWGIGDLADLRRFGEWATGSGDGFALISPLNAVAPVPPIEPSPYLPTSRRWRNPLYLRVEEVPGCAAALGADLDGAVAAGRALNADRQIDRDAVAILKLAALERIAAVQAPSAEFLAWRHEQGEDLERFALFCAIAETHGGDFREWPQGLQASDGEAARSLRRSAAARVDFHAWLQWLLDQQLAAASAGVPLMTDLPIGVHPGGADVWADPGLFARDFSVGAPPDLFNTLGQDWAQPPWHPGRLRARGYAPLVAVLRAGFAHAMGMRIDHVMGLFRLFWIARGQHPSAGVYVRYPAAEILDILALESVRAGAVVVGEDLGIVEPEVRDEMAARHILGYRLLWFEDVEPGLFPRRALSALTTHDLPTVAGVWSGSDTRTLQGIGVPVNESGTAEIRERLGRVAGEASRTLPEVVLTAYRALAHAPSMLVAAALEDAAEVVERPNIPGTTAALWPNWSLALPRPLGEVLASPLAAGVAEAMRRS